MSACSSTFTDAILIAFGLMCLHTFLQGFFGIGGGR